MHVILSIAGHDPIGGAGIQADIETAQALGCYANTLITCLTIQDSIQVYRIIPVDPLLLQQQAEKIFADLPISVIKIGLIGDLKIAQTIVSILKQFPQIPVVFDPILASGAGNKLSNQALITFIKESILPLCFLITPNMSEAKKLTGFITLETIATTLMTQGIKYILITGTDDSDPTEQQILHYLFQNNQQPIVYYKSRLNGVYHGSGCTLAMACACFIAQQKPIFEVVKQALDFTEQALIKALDFSQGQKLPYRRGNIN